MAENSLESIAKYLERSLVPSESADAERKLKGIESEPGFYVTLLHVIASSNLNLSVRLAAALFFKNLVKRKWVNEEGAYMIPIEDTKYIKAEILIIMTGLPSQLQVQVGEAVSIIAESDFPHNWENLIDDIVSKLSLTDFASNKGILIVAHSIFKRWRPLFRSDELFLEIKHVLEKFCTPFLSILKKVDELIIDAEKNQDKASLCIYLDNLLLLVQIYYDLNCQDIPEFFEDNLMAGMEIMYKYLNFDSALITDKSSDDEVDSLIKIKTAIIELVLLYITRYADIFEPLIETFITAVWKLINDYITQQQKFDLLVARVLSFLSVVTKMQNYQHLFNSEESIRQIIETIILPNVYFREVDEEQFEDEPIAYVRSDLEGSDFDSRRKSATDFLRELKEVNTGLLTSIVMEYIKNFLNGDLSDWRRKDVAIYLFSSLAAKGSVTNAGVTSTNVLVDVVSFFVENIASDLTNDTNQNPILKTDAIKYILTFRNQLTKEQLLTTFPMLISNLSNNNAVVHTYAAITIEKLLSMHDLSDPNHPSVFLKEDIYQYTDGVLKELFNLIIKDGSLGPEKLAENEFLMKAIMRMLSCVEDKISNEYRTSLLQQLLNILIIISKNLSNPKFSHYLFESLGFILKFGIANHENIESYINDLAPALIQLLTEDVQEFIPYTLQLLSYLLEKFPKNNGLPQSYTNLIKPLLSPTVWEFRGNIPAIVRLLIAILEHEPEVFQSSQESLTPLLGVFQKLISSKTNDIYGFDLLESILLNISLNLLEPSLKEIAFMLLSRLKNSRTEKYLKKFVVFINSLACIPLNADLNQKTHSQINADFAISLIELVQDGVFGQIFNSFILPASGNINNLLDKKIVNLGISQFILSKNFTSGKYTNLLLPSIDQLAINMSTFGGVSKGMEVSASHGITPGSAPIMIDDLDFESLSYGSQFSRLISIQVPVFDPVSQIKNNDENAITTLILSNIRSLSSLGVLASLSSDTEEKLKKLSS